MRSAELGFVMFIFALLLAIAFIVYLLIEYNNYFIMIIPVNKLGGENFRTSTPTQE